MHKKKIIITPIALHIKRSPISDSTTRSNAATFAVSTPSNSCSISTTESTTLTTGCADG